MMVFAVSSAQIDRRRWAPTLRAAQTGNDRGERLVTAILREKPHGKDSDATTAIQLKAAVRPLGKTLCQAERRRVHGRTLSEEHKANNGLHLGVESNTSTITG
jgi:hypothetical protein